VDAARGSAGRGSTSILLSRILTLLAEEEGQAGLILSGGIGSGKTRTAEALAADLSRRGVSVGGVLCPRILEKGETVGYRARDLATGEERPFACLAPPGVPIGRFFVPESALAFARAAVQRAVAGRVAIIDEVGRWELAGGGLAPAVRTLLSSPTLPVLLVRDAFVDAVVATFAIKRFEVFPIVEAR